MHESPISAFGFQGSGYILFDPVTGSGAYRITGGANGGFILAFALTVIAIFGALTLLTGGIGAIILGLVILAFEIWAVDTWAKAIAKASSGDEFDQEAFNKANFVQAMLALLAIIMDVLFFAEEALVFAELAEAIAIFVGSYLSFKFLTKYF